MPAALCGICIRENKFSKTLSPYKPSPCRAHLKRTAAHTIFLAVRQSHSTIHISKIIFYLEIPAAASAIAAAASSGDAAPVAKSCS